MSADINLYKINDVKNFKKKLSKEDYIKFEKEKNTNDNESNMTTYHLYYHNENKDSKISWDWILHEFKTTINQYTAKPKAVLYIKKENKHYAVSFGYAYHLVGKFADINWPLEFAERMEYNTIRSVGIYAPNSLINKKIYNYFNYNYLEADSGEALDRISANLILDESEEEFLFDHILIGNSIKFKIKNENLENISKLLDFIEIIMAREPINPIPKLKEVKNENKIKDLNKNLVEKIRSEIISSIEEPSINISEFAVDGFKYIFYNEEFNHFIFELNDKQKQYPTLCAENIYDFILKENLINENILNIKIGMYSITEYKTTLNDLIMYADNEYIFDSGKWYEYNSVFYNQIHDDLQDISVYHYPEYDFLTKDKFDNERESLNERLTDVTIGKNKFEYFFNNYVSDKEENWLCLDHKLEKIEEDKFEPTDILDKTNGTMYAVKVGNSASKLSYVVDQSLITLKLLEENKVDAFNKNEIKNIGIWIIFTRGDNYLPLENNTLEWESLKMLILKSKLAEWKKRVHLAGKTPVININYRYKK